MTYFRILMTMLLAISGMVLSTSAMAALEKRVALIIGNGAYSNAPPLANPVTDARAMAEKMRALGFEIVEGYDLNKSGLEGAVRTFANLAKDADLSLFFYAGHGIAVENRNYIVPVDARFADAAALDFEAVPVGLVTKHMQYSQGVSLVFLDACRDNPLAKTLSRSMGGSTRSSGVASGLAAMKISNPGKGLAIAFATSPGAVAYDGKGPHSPFTSALLKHIDQPNTDITEIMSRVTGEVVRSTAQKQRPWLNTSLTGSVILNRVEEVTAGQEVQRIELGKKEPSQTSSYDNLERQKVLYSLARETERSDDYRAYLETFPNGLFSANARRSLSRLEGKPKETKVASLDTDEAPSLKIKPAAVSSIEMRENTEPLDLPTNVAVARIPANAEIEALLEMDREKRVEVQKRLTVAGYKPGGADGVFGSLTRKAVGNWQGKNGLEVSGFLNAPQLQMLMQQTEEKLASYVPVVKKPVVRKSVVRSVKRKTAKKVVKRRIVKKKRVTKRRVVKKKKVRTAKRKVRKTHRPQRRAVKRRQYRNEGYEGYLERRRRNRRGTIAGAIVGGLVGGVIIRRKH